MTQPFSVYYVLLMYKAWGNNIKQEKRMGKVSLDRKLLGLLGGAAFFLGFAIMAPTIFILVTSYPYTYTGMYLGVSFVFGIPAVIASPIFGVGVAKKSKKLVVISLGLLILVLALLWGWYMILIPPRY
ncbi:MAG: hypothetical protein PHE50_05305 [Dehalococcoidales bacterium]|nr:hypothetical protein [Dehalococcoidales bacterium]